VAKSKTSTSSRQNSRSRASKASKNKSSRRSGSRRSSSRSRKQNVFKSPLRLARDRRTDIIGLILIGLGILSLLSMLSPEQGVVTGFWLKILKHGFGWGMIALPFAFLIGGVWLLRRTVGEREKGLDNEQILGSVLLYLALLIVMHGFLEADDLQGRLALARQGQGGGVIGAALLSLLLKWLGSGGTFIVMVAWILIGFTFSMSVSVPEMLDYVTRAFRWVVDKWPNIRLPQSEKKSSITTKPVIPTIPTKPEVPDPKLQPVGLVAERVPVTPSVAGSPQTVTWILPSIKAILEPGIEGKADATFDKERARVIEETLDAFGAPARVVEINRGPTITQFGVEPDYIEGRRGRRTKVKVSKIAALADDLALALAAPSIRIEAPVPKKGFVGVEVPNAEISLVSLRDVMESEVFKKVGSKLALGLGQDVSGHAVAADLGAMPHLLIAGTTGSGKSVCVNSIITCLLLQNKPNELQFVMIDPKRVELTYYNGIPHLLAPVIVELENVVGSLKWISREMDERYRRFAREGVRNITEFNKRMETIHQPKLPFLVVVIDELADLMMLAPDETERLITRMAQLARATGIHLVIATQRPSVDVVTGIIKANFPSRVAFAVASSVDSRVILDQPGAERLLGRGDMLFQAPDASSPVRMQGAFVSEMELNRLIRYWKNAAIGGEVTRPTTAMPEEMIPIGVPLRQVPLWEEVESENEAEDELYDEAVEIVRNMRRASISLLQRRMRIGYTRAARLIDIMEENGVIGPATGGSKPREVLDFGEMVELEGE
jgi:S-DNA-T family DNA segregation ATPase FtsK/SpoIIIE